MYTLKIHGTRRNILAFHHCETYDEVRELLEVYRALGYAPDMLEVEERQQEQAA